jgi:molecular chaperone DnaK
MAGEIPVQAGIDLGMGNSKIAVLDGNQIRLIPGEDGNEIIPSAVHIDDNSVAVGWRALSLMRQTDCPGETFRFFKRRMGHDFARGSKGKPLSPVRLSSEVLKAVRESYRRTAGIRLCAAVVTYPARFTPAAVKATKEAAQEAGLRFTQLLQEPVAASVAYGFTGNQIQDYWLVVDWGAGTLDIVVLGPKDGGGLEVVVPGGDDNLGGYDLDELIYDRIAKPWLDGEYELKGFADQKSRYRGAFMRLMFAIEQAKIKLSEVADPKEKVFIRPDPPHICDDDRGRRVFVEIPITREEYEGIIGPTIVEEVVVLCREVLSDAERTVNEQKKGEEKEEEKRRFDWHRDVKGILLVGGVTKTPCVRRALRDNLRLDLDTSVDPITVVARGAGIHAATVRLPDKDDALRNNIYGDDRRRGKVRVDVHTNGKVSEPFAKVIIDVVPEESQATVGDLRVRVRRGDGKFISDSLVPDRAGRCELTVELLENRSNTFEVEVLDRQGDPLEVSAPGGCFTILHLPFEGITPKVPRPVRVQLKGNRTSLLVEEGQGIPAEGFVELETTVPLKRGEAGDVLRMPILVGDSEWADRNIPVGEVVIHSKEIERDVPVRSPVDLAVQVSVSGEIQADAEVPLLMRTFHRVLQFPGVDVKDDMLNLAVAAAKRGFGYVTKAVETNKEAARAESDAELEKQAEELEKLLEDKGIKQKMARVEEQLTKATQNNDPVARQTAYQDALRLLDRLDEPTLFALKVECDRYHKLVRSWHDCRDFILGKPDMILAFAEALFGKLRTSGVPRCLWVELSLILIESGLFHVLGSPQKALSEEDALAVCRAWYGRKRDEAEEARAELENVRRCLSEVVGEIERLRDRISDALAKVRSGQAVRLEEFSGKPPDLQDKAHKITVGSRWSAIAYELWAGATFQASKSEKVRKRPGGGDDFDLRKVKIV